MLLNYLAGSLITIPTNPTIDNFKLMYLLADGKLLEGQRLCVCVCARERARADSSVRELVGACGSAREPVSVRSVTSW